MQRGDSLVALESSRRLIVPSTLPTPWTHARIRSSAPCFARCMLLPLYLIIRVEDLYIVEMIGATPPVIITIAITMTAYSWSCKT